MTRFEEIVETIKGLPPERFSKPRSWINQADGDDWDRQMREDLAAGRLGDALEEADREIAQGQTEPWP